MAKQKRDPVRDRDDNSGGEGPLSNSARQQDSIQSKSDDSERRDVIPLTGPSSSGNLR